MKKTISFEKKITFPTMIGEITAIELDHTLKFIDSSTITGDFIVSGKYKLTEASRLEDDFDYKIPTDITLLEKLDLSTAKVDITDFYYEIENDDTMICNIEIKIEGLEEITLDEEDNLVRNIDSKEIDSKLSKELPIIDTTELKKETTISSLKSEEITEIPVIDRKKSKDNEKTNNSNLESQKESSTQKEDTTFTEFKNIKSENIKSENSNSKNIESKNIEENPNSKNTTSENTEPKNNASENSNSENTESNELSHSNKLSPSSESVVSNQLLNIKTNTKSEQLEKSSSELELTKTNEQIKKTEERECDGDIKTEEEKEIPKKEIPKKEPLNNNEDRTPEKNNQEKNNQEITSDEEITKVETKEEDQEAISSIFSALQDTEETFSTYSVYILRQEETINSVIEKYKTTQEELEKYNDLSTLSPGTKIIIPTPSE